MVLSGADSGPRRLSDDECHRLLARHDVGRLAFVVGGQPLVVPVNYAFCHDRVVFRTGEGLKLRRTPRHRVAFEIDAVDEARRVGWSVLVKGCAYDITRADDPLAEELRRLPLSPLGTGEMSHWIEIVPLEITGRLVTSSLLPPGTQRS